MRGRLKALMGRRGETLMEGVVSLLIFSVLIASVTMMIAASMRITSQATARANDDQEDVNAALAGDGTNSSESIIFTIGDGPDEISVPITITSAGDFIAFAPP
jgi:type II secretory pathway component PulJ